MMEKVKRKIKTNTKPKEPVTGLAAPQKLKILITIVDRSKTEFYVDILEAYDVNMQAIVYGKGTAPGVIQQYLGLYEENKTVILSVIQGKKEKEILNAYEEKYFKTKNGKGIAFTIPISSVIGVMIYQFLSNSVEFKRGE